MKADDVVAAAIPPIPLARRRRRVGALDVFMKSAQKLDLVGAPYTVGGPKDVSEDRHLSHLAFQALDIGQKAFFQAQADAINAQNLPGDQETDKQLLEEHLRAL